MIKVLISSSDSIVSKFTQFVTRGSYGHIAFIISRKQYSRLCKRLDLDKELLKYPQIVLEAGVLHGFHFSKLDLNQYDKHLTYEIKDKELKDAWIIENYGVPYGVAEILGFILHSPLKSKGLICSEAVFKGLVDAFDIDDFDGFDGSKISPRDAHLILETLAKAGICKKVEL